MNIKAIKSTLLAAIVTAVLCAGTVSARQLRSEPKASPPVAGAAARINLARVAASAPFRWSRPLAFARRIRREFNRRQNSWGLFHLFRLELFGKKEDEP